MDAKSIRERVRRARMDAGRSSPDLTQIKKGGRHTAPEVPNRLARELKTTSHWLLRGARPQDQKTSENIDAAIRIAELERQLAVAQDTINNLSKALAQGRINAAPASGACGGGAHREPAHRERRTGA